MKKLIKKLAVLSALIMALSCLTGCGEKFGPKAGENYDKIVAATYGDTQIMLDEANFFLRYQQAMMEGSYWSLYEYMGYPNMWMANYTEDKMLETYVKESVMQQLHQTLVLIDHAGDYNLSPADIDEALCTKQANKVIEELDSKFFEYAPVTGEQLAGWFKENALAYKVYEAVKAEQSAEASKEETEMYTITYVSYANSEDEQKAEERAKEVYDKLKAGSTVADLGDTVNFITESYLIAGPGEEDAEGTKQIYEKTKDMKAGDILQFEIDGTWYVVYCNEDLDEEATAAKKEEVLDAKKDEKFAEIYAKWQDDAPKFEVKAVYENLVMTDGEMMLPTEAGTSAVG